jgi:hypothetical protein
MPLKKQTWESIPERDRRNNYYSEEQFNDGQEELSELAERYKKEMTPEEFAEWLSDHDYEWIDD